MGVVAQDVVLGDYMGVARSKEGGTDQHRAVLRMNEARV